MCTYLRICWSITWECWLHINFQRPRFCESHRSGWRSQFHARAAPCNFISLPVSPDSLVEHSNHNFQLLSLHTLLLISDKIYHTRESTFSKISEVELHFEHFGVNVISCVFHDWFRHSKYIQIQNIPRERVPRRSERIQDDLGISRRIHTIGNYFPRFSSASSRTFAEHPSLPPFKYLISALFACGYVRVGDDDGIGKATGSLY